MPVLGKDIPEPSTEKKPVPKKTALDKNLPEETKLNKEMPEGKVLNKEMPEGKALDKPMPPEVNPDNVVVIGGKEIEIKSTKIKYQRNGTATAYRILDLYPLPDILSMDAGVLDAKRDGDQIVFDFLVAVFDDSKLVARYYDTMTADDIDRCVKIFKRLNHIDEKEEAAKNRQAKGMSN